MDITTIADKNKYPLYFYALDQYIQNRELPHQDFPKLKQVRKRYISQYNDSKDNSLIWLCSDITALLSLYEEPVNAMNWEILPIILDSNQLDHLYYKHHNNIKFDNEFNLGEMVKSYKETIEQLLKSDPPNYYLIYYNLCQYLLVWLYHVSISRNYFDLDLDIILDHMNNIIPKGVDDNTMKPKCDYIIAFIKYIIGGDEVEYPKQRPPSLDSNINNIMDNMIKIKQLYQYFDDDYMVSDVKGIDLNIKNRSAYDKLVSDKLYTYQKLDDKPPAQIMSYMSSDINILSLMEHYMNDHNIIEHPTILYILNGKTRLKHDRLARQFK